MGNKKSTGREDGPLQFPFMMTGNGIMMRMPCGASVGCCSAGGCPVGHMPSCMQYQPMMLGQQQSIQPQASNQMPMMTQMMPSTGASSWSPLMGFGMPNSVGGNRQMIRNFF